MYEAMEIRQDRRGVFHVDGLMETSWLSPMEPRSISVKAKLRHSLVGDQVPRGPSP